MSILLVSWLLVVGCWLSHLPKLVNLECVGILWNVWKVLENVGMVGMCWNELECWIVLECWCVVVLECVGVCWNVFQAL